MTQLEADNARISALGGAAKVAALLGVRIQVVSNWKTRGIPYKVKVQHPQLFLVEFKDRRKTARTPSPTEPTTI